jgi:hypothetical protein
MTFMDEFTHTSTLQLHPDRSKLRGIKPQEIKVFQFQTKITTENTDKLKTMQKY